jgi:hypothetical protein
MTDVMSSYLAEANHVEQGGGSGASVTRFRAKSWRRTFDLEEYVIKEVVTFVRRGLDKVKKANAKALRYPQRHFGVSPRSLSYSAGVRKAVQLCCLISQKCSS